MNRPTTICMGAALLALALTAAACGSGNDCEKACKKVTKCISTGDAGAAKSDVETPTPYSGTTCGLSEVCSPKEECLAGCLLDADCAAITGQDKAGQAALSTCQATCNNQQWDGGTKPAPDSGAKPTPDKGVCTPSCEGRQCGPDGCGGSCGGCTAPKVCNTQTGQCVSSCTPSCSGRECGDNGCGGSCGSCSPPLSCTSAGLCACQPQCSGKQCGPDGCGGSCGNCPGGAQCQSNGTCSCQPQCAGKQCGSDGCGGFCGNCPSQHTCDATGMCVSTSPTWTIVMTALNEAHPGNLGGLSGADALCQAQANATGHKGVYKAFLSGATRDAKDLVVGTDAATVEVTNINGQKLYDSWNQIFASTKWSTSAQLFSFNGTLVDEGKVSPDWYDARAWHGSHTNGTVRPGYDCGSWSTTVGTGACGELDIVAWLSTLTNTCDTHLAVVCVKTAP